MGENILILGLCNLKRKCKFALPFNEKGIKRCNADVVKLVDTLDLGSSAARCVGSSPSIRTKFRKRNKKLFLFFWFLQVNFRLK